VISVSNIFSLKSTNEANYISTEQVALWKKYIAWEKSNPLRTEDLPLLARRVMFAYEQCLLCLSHHPDVWYEAALYLETVAKQMTEKGVKKHITVSTNIIHNSEGKSM